MKDSKEKSIDKVLSEATPEYWATRFLKRVIFVSVIILASIFCFAHFDKPQSTGETIRGEVISLAAAPNSYRSLNATTMVTIELEDGGSLYRKIKGAYVGMVVDVRVYKRRLSRIKSYEL